MSQAYGSILRPITALGTSACRFNDQCQEQGIFESWVNAFQMLGLSMTCSFLSCSSLELKVCYDIRLGSYE
jgi:hypothetical protein